MEVGGTVAIVRGEEPDKLVKEALDHLSGIENIISGDTALIKPNLGPWVAELVPNFVNRWATTKPEIIVALIKELKNSGVKHVSVAEGASVGMNSVTQFEESGIKEMVEAAGGTVIDLDRCKHEKLKVSRDLTVEVAEPVLETDNLINVPVMKTHFRTRLTLGIKNLKGVISEESKRAMHRGNLEQSIALLCKLLKPRLTIIDGLTGMEGLGPAVFGKPVKLGLLIAGTDPVGVDAVAATVMGHDPKEIEHIRIAWELGLGEIELDKIKIKGVPIEEVKHPFEPAKLGIHNIIEKLGMEQVRYHGWKPGTTPSECSGCFASVMNALVAVYDDAKTLQKQLDIVVGPTRIADEVGDNILLYGDCQAKNKNSGVWLPGCPPNLRDAYTLIAKMGLTKTKYFTALTKRILKGKKVSPLPQWEQYRETT